MDVGRSADVIDLILNPRTWPVGPATTVSDVTHLLGDGAGFIRQKSILNMSYLIDGTLWAFWWHGPQLTLFEMHPAWSDDASTRLAVWFNLASGLRLTSTALARDPRFVVIDSGEEPGEELYEGSAAPDYAVCQIACTDGAAWKYLFSFSPSMVG